MLQHPTPEVRRIWQELVDRKPRGETRHNDQAELAFGRPSPIGLFKPAGATPHRQPLSSHPIGEAERRWATYSSLPSSFAPKLTAEKETSDRSEPGPSPASVASAPSSSAEAKPLLAMFEAELAKLMSPKSESATQAEDAPDPPLTELPPQSEESAPSAAEAAANTRTPGELFVSSIKSAMNGLNQLSTTVLDANPELRQRILQTHRDLPPNLQAILRTGMAVANNYSGSRSTADAAEAHADRGDARTPGDAAVPAEVLGSPPIFRAENTQKPAPRSRRFEAEKILARRYICYDNVNNGPRYKQYLIRWAQSGAEDDVWYDEENLLSSCKPLIEEFEREHAELQSVSYDEQRASAYDAASVHCRTSGDRMVTFTRYMSRQAVPSAEQPSIAQDITSIDGRIGGPVPSDTGSNLKDKSRASASTARAKDLHVSFARDRLESTARMLDRGVPTKSSDASSEDHSVLGAETKPFTIDPVDVMSKYPPVSQISAAPQPAASVSDDLQHDDPQSSRLGDIRRARTTCFRDASLRRGGANELRRSASLAFDPRRNAQPAPARAFEAAFAPASHSHQYVSPLEANRPQHVPRHARSFGNLPRYESDKIRSCVEQLISMGYKQNEAEPVACICEGDLHKAIDQLEEDRKAWVWRSERASGEASQQRADWRHSMPGSWDVYRW